MDSFRKLTESVKNLKCAVCGKAFKYKSKLSRHELTHTKTKNFDCRYCGKKFSLAYNLKVHIRIHLGLKPYKCKYPGCEKYFTQSNNLTVHYKTHNVAKVVPEPPEFLQHIRQSLLEKINTQEQINAENSEFEIETTMSEADLL